MLNMRELTMSDDEIKLLCLMGIDEILYFYGKTLKNYSPMSLTTEVNNDGNIENKLDLYGPELLNSINYSGLSLHKLILKIGVSVMNITYEYWPIQWSLERKNHVKECEVITDKNGLKVLLMNHVEIFANSTINVVYKKVFLKR
ncbi:hypothetical protein Ahy_A03g014584 [Arachis hypogaea]|uniref:DNA helicase Pif1-like 2B domain-containing protein n=1 Tax=Arachis hypogaea TaxID=3818 RepID=A0A445DY57_ARAHY|nr:hypothetical protein Ahy_A03g014584 [Arachis hypogaea]